ncbi:hypothetical protein XW81_02155 [Buchnera aphidicola (Schlechtendalia chinensis)]|uniref:BolA family transcriptional regulator n=1 Tax=Buchnera aphidicola subsp. Schlechtendalia chinensis TaxID=118110 RepID=A0A172WE13_BUCSC|nr:BolA/IbaG family iron-sulfur metabolism protein [Buchnera aphidicola]ANF17182.1 hypothetical protein XW81_02155 [Buchnera aphidicola (Schlechtendalia chinensis)]
MIIKKIKDILTSVLNVQIIKVFNQSKKHKLSSNYSHIKIVVVSDDFVNYNLLKRHKKIYHLLSECITQYKIHGIALHTYTIYEWKSKINKNLFSPKCIK